MAQSELFSIAGKNVVITGAAAGIGFALAERFIGGGANVVLCDLNEAAVFSAAKKLQAGPGKAVPLCLDVGANDAGNKAIEACVKAFGSIDVLVNNAGIYPQVPMLKMSADAFDRVIAVNLRGLALMSKAAGLRFVEQGKGGQIINIGSVDSLHPSMVGLAAYDASKGGVLMFTRAFAREMAPYKVRVNAVLPGGVATEGTNQPLAPGVTPEQAKAYLDGFIAAKVPMGRIGLPDEIAGAVIYFASAASAYTTGASLVVDGGMLLT